MAALCLAFGLSPHPYIDKVSAPTPLIAAATVPGSALQSLPTLLCADGTVHLIGQYGSGATYTSDLPEGGFHDNGDGTALIATGNVPAMGTYTVTTQTGTTSETARFELLPMPAEHTLYIQGVKTKSGILQYDPANVRPATGADRLVGVYRNWRGADRNTEVATYLAPFTSDHVVVYARLENAAGCHRVVPVELRPR